MNDERIENLFWRLQERLRVCFDLGIDQIPFTISQDDCRELINLLAIARMDSADERKGDINAD